MRIFALFFDFFRFPAKIGQKIEFFGLNWEKIRLN